MSGTVQSGTSPIVGAIVSLWTTGTGVAQVAQATTGANGTFSFNYACPSPNTTLMYTMAVGGHVGAGAANSAIQLTSALGACNALPVSIVMNEFTTASAAYALSGFSAPSTGGNATVQFQGKSPGLGQAFNTLTNLVNTGTGVFDNSGPETNKTQVQQTLDTLANAMAACDASSSAAGCTEFFSCATPNSTYVSTGQPCTQSGTPTLPTDVLSAALSVTRNAGIVGLAGIFDVGASGTAAFSPVLGASPNDWTLPLKYTLSNFGPLAIDAAGHVWIITVDPTPPGGGVTPSLVLAEYDAAFNLLSPLPHYFNGGGLAAFDHTDLSNLAIDTQGNVWVGGGNFTATSVSSKIVELNSSGVALSGANGYNAGNGPDGTAGVTIDIGGNAWFASGDTAATLFELSSAGALLSPSAGTAASNCPCNGVASDPSGNIWTVGSAASEYLAEIPVGTQTQGGIVHPSGYSGATFYSIAADHGGNLWIADQHDGGVWEYTPGTGFLPSSGGPFPNIGARNNASHPKGIAIDGAGHKWVANEGFNGAASGLAELSADGTLNLSPTDGFGSGISGAYSVAIDGSGNVWVADGGTTVIQFIGAAAPTKTPIAAAVATGFTP